MAGAFVVLVLLVFGITHLLGGGGATKALSTPSGSVAPGHSTTPTTTVLPATVTVAVLNAAGISGLAAKIATRVGNAGYLKGKVGDAAGQSHATTTSVEYAVGDEQAARQVAKLLHLRSSAVAPLDPATAANSLVSAAQVVVLVGSDL